MRAPSGPPGPGRALHHMHVAAPASASWKDIAALFALLTVAATWPQAVEPAGITPHQDAWFNMWRLDWVSHQLARDPRHLFDANIYAPERGTLAYSDAMLLQGIIGAPLVWAGLPVAYLHTLLVLSSFVFAGTSAWALAHALTGSRAAGLLAGLTFAFAPYRFDHYMHLELLWTGFMPLTLLVLHRALERGSSRAGVAAGVLWAAQLLSCIYYGVFFATLLVPFAAVLALRAGGRRFGAARGLACGAAVAALAAVLYARPYEGARAVVGERSGTEAALYSAGPTHYLSATPDNLLYGHLTAGLGRSEKRLFPGLVALGLAAFALWPPLDARRLAYGTALVAGIDLSFGTNGILFGALREHAAAYRGLRVPARAAAPALLMVAVLAGYGLVRVRQLVSSDRQALLTNALLILAAAEYLVMPRPLVRAPVTPPAVYSWLAAQPAGIVLELPVPREHELPLHDAEFAYYSTFHHQRLANGYSGSVPPGYVQTLRALDPFPTAQAFARLRAAQVRYLIVHGPRYGASQLGELLAALERTPEVRELARFGAPGPETVAFELLPRSPHD